MLLPLDKPHEPPLKTVSQAMLFCYVSKLDFLVSFPTDQAYMRMQIAAGLQMTLSISLPSKSFASSAFAQQQLQVEDGMVLLHWIYDQMGKELDKGHNATKLQKRKHSQTHAIEQALSVRSSWLLLAGLASPALDTAAMKEVFIGG